MLFDGPETAASLMIGGREGTEGLITRFGGDGFVGDCFAFVQRQRGGDFPAALEFLSNLYGVTRRDPPAKPRAPKGTKPAPSTIYKVRDAAGEVVAFHHRTDGPDGKKMWFSRAGYSELGLHGLSPKDLPLYGLPEVLEYPEGTPIVLCEGEKAQEALRAAGWPAVGTYGTSATPTPAVLEPILPYTVILWPDADGPAQKFAGQRHMVEIGSALANLGATVLVADWPDAPEKGDAADFVADHSPQALADLLAAAVPFDDADLPTGETGHGAEGTKAEASCPPTPRVVFGTAEDLDRTLAGLTWIWPGFIPRGHITFLGGKPDAGKSSAMLELAGRMYTGQPWPDGTLHDLAGQSVVWADTESGEGMTRDRMRDWAIPTGAVRWPMTGEPPVVWRVRLERQKGEVLSSLQVLEGMLRENPSPLLIIDSLQGAVPGRDLDKADTQTLLAPWAEMAQRLNIAIVILHHVRKGLPGEDRAYTLTFEDLRGSGAIGAVGRSVLLIDYPDAGSHLKRLRVDKLNFCAPPAPVGLEITADGVLFDGDAPKPPRRDQERARAEDWLMEVLKRGKRARPEVIALGKQEGFSERTIDLAFSGDARFASEKDPTLPVRRLWFIRDQRL
jgi:hypothetical protein